MQHKVRELKFIKLYEKENLKNCTCRRHKVVNWTSRNFNIGPVNYSSAARSDYSFQYIYLFGTSTSSCNLKTTGGPFDGFAVRERRCLEPRIAPSGTFASVGHLFVLTQIQSFGSIWMTFELQEGGQGWEAGA